MKPEDQLIDALLKEQAKNRAADETLLADIEASLCASAKPITLTWRRMLPMGIAASVALCISGAYIASRSQQQRDIVMSPPKPSDRQIKFDDLIDRVRNEPGNVSTPAPATRDEDAELSAAKDMFKNVEELSEGSSATTSQASAGMEKKQTSAAPRQTVVVSNAPTTASIPMSEVTVDATPINFANETDTPQAWGRASEANPMRKSEREVARLRRANTAPMDTRRFGQLVDQAWQSPWDHPLSTFSIDVDNASYTNIRRMINEGREIPKDAVRIEECINYFDYAYAGPQDDKPFAVLGTLATCPWKPEHLLARVAIKGKEVDIKNRPASNLVFLIDVSGSMQSDDKLALLKKSLTLLVDQLDERDHVGIVVYAGCEGVALAPTKLDSEGKVTAKEAIARLESGGSTNGGAGIQRAYEMALGHMKEGGVNRVILATDGDFNVGTTGQGDLVSMVKDKAAKGVNLSVLGFGNDNLNDSMLEAITNDGNGNYFYIDGLQEARRVFENKLTGTLVTIAKDVKIQIEFNPGKVQAYRLIGYANRMLRDEDFNNDKVDAGDIGAGHTVTAFYEIVPVGVEMPNVGGTDALRYQKPADAKAKELVESKDWLTLKLRYKQPEGSTSSLITTPVAGEPGAWDEAGNDFRVASAVALFGMKLRAMDDVADVSWDKVEEIAKPTLAQDPKEQRSEFLQLVEKLKGR